MDYHGLFGRVTILTRLVKPTFLGRRVTRSFSHCARLRAANGTGDTADLAAGDNSELFPSRVRRSWTPEELDIFYRMRDELATPTEIAEAVGRTIPSVLRMREKAAALPREVLREGLRMQRTAVIKPFSPQEDSEMLALLANGESPKSVAAELRRSVQSVKSRMRRLGEKAAENHRGPWTAEEINLLQSWKAEGVTIASIASRLGRRSDSVEYQLARSKLPQAYSLWRAKDPWTAAEDEQLRSLKAQGLNRAQIHEHMPHRSAQSIGTRYGTVDLKVLGPRKREGTWTAEETDILRDLVAQKKSRQDMVAILARSGTSIAHKIGRDKSIRNIRPPAWRWSEGHIKSMSRMREAGLTWTEIAASFPRCADSCRKAFGEYTSPCGAPPLYKGTSTAVWSAEEIGKILEMRALQRPGHSKWSVEEIEKLLEMRASKRPYGEIAASLGRSVKSCQRAFARHCAARSRQAPPSSGENKGAPS